MSAANNKQIGGTHYQSALQHWDFVQFHRLDYMEAMVLKYTSRSRKKNGLEDLNKAIHFVEKLLQPEIPFTSATLEEYIEANKLNEDEAKVSAWIMQYHENPGSTEPLWQALGLLNAMAERTK